MMIAGTDFVRPMLYHHSMFAVIVSGNLPLRDSTAALLRDFRHHPTTIWKKNRKMQLVHIS
jgi:hypothetical protein